MKNLKQIIQTIEWIMVGVFCIWVTWLSISKMPN